MSEMVDSILDVMQSRGLNADEADVLAILAAMREPTEAMLLAAKGWSYLKYGKPIGDDDATGCWQAMLGAAVKE